MNDDLIYRDFEYANSFKLGELIGQKIIQAVNEKNIDEIIRLMKLPVDEGGLLLLRRTAKDKNGKTAKELALNSKNKEIIDLFE
jgi:hypothetical protein